MNSIFKADALKGHTAFITGGGSGICKGIATALGLHGARVFLGSRKEEVLKSACAELKSKGITAAFSVMDVRDPVQVDHALQACASQLGGPSIVVNGAAGNFLAPAAALSPNGFKTVTDIDLNGTFNVCRAAFPLLCEQKNASILNISATLHYASAPLMTHAAAAKAGVDALTRNLSVEWGPLGIRVNGMAPGPIEGTEGMTRLLPPTMKEKMLARIPLRRMGTVEDCGNAAVFLSSDAAAYVSGAILVVDGGAWLAGRLSPEEMAEV